MREMLRTCLIFALLAGAANAQQPAARSASVSLSGQVVKATDGSPLANARIDLAGVQDQSSGFHARSDARGTFQLRNVTPGTYRLSVHRSGYAPATYPRALVIVANKETDDIVVRLQPQAVIVGRVVDDNGEPRPGVEVRAVNKADLRKPARAAITNDLGEYRLYGLGAGEYFLSATDTGDPYVTDYELRAGDIEAAGAREYAPTYYPGTASRSEAAPLKISPGEEVRVDFKLLRAKQATISGRVLGGNDADVVLQPDPSEAALGGLPIDAKVDAAGRFIARDIPPGKYLLFAVTTLGDREFNARRAIEVNGEDQTGIELALAPLRTVRGRVTISDGTLPSSEHPMFVWLRNRDGEEMGFGSAEVQPDGTFIVIPELPEGVYDVTLTGAPATAYVSAEQSGTEDVLKNGLAIANSASIAPLAITLDTSGGMVAGVLEQGQLPAAGTPVRLVGRDYTAEVLTDDLGVFAFIGLRPGDYQVSQPAADVPDSAKVLGRLTLAAGELKVLHFNVASD